MRRRGEVSEIVAQPFRPLLTVARIPAPARRFVSSRRLADDARPAVPHVYSKNPKRKTFKRYPTQVLSEHQLLLL